ncbi:MAG: hypothetical protein AAGK02_02925, partial [Pseudomonadota bacterium]
SLFAGIAATSVPAIAKAAMVLPSGQFRLFRRLVRGLHDGKSIIVEREWQVGFSGDGRGMAITGEQLSAKVAAPEKLAAFARLEERRSTNDMFPILLDGNGTVMVAGPYIAGDDLDAAVSLALEIIASRPIAEAEKARQKQFLAQLQQAGGSLLDKLPPDLFFPRTDFETTARPVSLPGGMAGEFELTYITTTQSETDLLASAERRIVTRIGSSERVSFEEWSLTPI